MLIDWKFTSGRLLFNNINMKLITKMITIAGLAAALVSCSDKAAKNEDFKYLVDEFADLKIMRYQVPGWNELSLQQKEYVYHLAEAAKYGRDIIWMQNCKYNLEIRKVLENILENYTGDKTTEDWKGFETYAKRVFFSNGIHHHYAEDKFFPECPQEYFQSLMATVGDEEKCAELLPVIYDPEIFPARKDMHAADIVASSAVNFYENVTRAEVEALYAAMTDPNDKTPVSYGLNSRVVKGEDGVVREEVYKVNGLYGAALEKICSELEKAAAVAENQTQKDYIADLVNYYMTGDLKLWDEYNIKWVNDIYMDGKKVCGILSEAVSDMESGRISHIIIGIGLNFSVPQNHFPADLQEKATSVFPDGQASITRNQLISKIWQKLFTYLSQPKKALDFYKEKSFVLGKTVSFNQKGTTYVGLAKEIGHHGELIVQTNEQEMSLSSGEISLTSIRTQ